MIGAVRQTRRNTLRARGRTSTTRLPVIASDSFNRANGALSSGGVLDMFLGGGPSNATWSSENAAVVIDSNSVRNTSATNAYQVAVPIQVSAPPLGAAACEAEATVVALPGASVNFVCIGLSGVTVSDMDMYAAGVNLSGALTLRYAIDAGFTTLHTSAIVVAAGDRIGVRRRNQIVDLLHNGITVASVNDLSVTTISFWAGMRFAGDGGVGRFDDFVVRGV